MENTIISVINTVGDTVCVETADGQKVFEVIKKFLSEEQSVTLSFLNIEMMIYWTNRTR